MLVTIAVAVVVAVVVSMVIVVAGVVVAVVISNAVIVVAAGVIAKVVVVSKAFDNVVVSVFLSAHIVDFRFPSSQTLKRFLQFFYESVHSKNVTNVMSPRYNL